MSDNRGSDFIRDFIREDLKAAEFAASTRGFRPSPTPTCTSATPRPCGSTTASPWTSAASSTCVSTTPTPPRKSRSTSTPSSRTCAGSGPTGSDRLFFASDYFEQMYAWAEELIRKGKAYVDDLTRRRGQRASRHAHRSPARTARSATAPSRRTSTSSAACGPASSPTAAATLRAKIDMASPNLNMRDPVMYRILHADAPPPGRQVVHLPDVRLGPRPGGLHRGHHALAVLAGIREPPAAVRLVPRAPRHLPPAADRVRPPEPDLHRHEQAAAAGAGARRRRAAAWTIRGCRRWRACAAAATRPRPIRDFCQRIGIAKTD